MTCNYSNSLGSLVLPGVKRASMLLIILVRGVEKGKMQPNRAGYLQEPKGRTSKSDLV